jgi:hypothetical protein
VAFDQTKSGTLCFKEMRHHLAQALCYHDFKYRQNATSDKKEGVTIWLRATFERKACLL